METQAVIFRETDGIISTEMVDMKKQRLISLLGLYRIMIFSDHTLSSLWNIPVEIITQVPQYIKTSSTKTFEEPENKYDVLYLENTKDYSNSATKAIISALNTSIGLKILLITDEVNLSVISELINDHIDLLAYDNINWHNYVRHNTIIISSEKNAVEALLLELPVIIVGTNGLGGLVTDNNITEMIKSSFRGRVGGVNGEKVPIRLLLNEITQAQNIKANHQLSPMSRMLINAKYSNIPISHHIKTCLSECQDLQRKLNDIQLVQNLTPIPNANIRFIPVEDGNYMVIRDAVCQILALISSEEMRFINCCRHQHSFSNIISENGFNLESETHDFIKALWNEKIISFIHH